MRYADPTLCPDCRSPLPSGVPVCPTCELLVRHPIAVSLFQTLRRADVLVGELREASEAFHDRPVPAPTTAVPDATRVDSLGGPVAPPSAPFEPKRAVPAGAPFTPPSPTLAPPTPPRPPYSAGPSAPRPERGGVAFASVPKILLGLGAFCLLVAAITFLAVSWSVLGVGGRTAVLGGLTLAAGASALLAHRAGLRIAGESLVVVALGLLALDVFGAGAADWFGEVSDGAVTCAAGLTVAVAGILLSLLRIGGQPRLVAPQVIVGIALWTAHLGAVSATTHDAIASHVMTALAVAAVFLGRRQDLMPLQWSAAVAGTFAWLGAASAAGVDALDNPTLHQMWADGSGWSLLLTAAVLTVPGLLLNNRQLLVVGASFAAMVVTAVLTLPSLDEGATTVGVVTLAVTALWVVALAVLPSSARTIAIAPAGSGSLLLLGLSGVAAVVALIRWAESTVVFDRPIGVMLSGEAPVTEPLLVIPSLLVPLAFLALLTPDRGRTTLSTWLPLTAIVAGLGATTTLASYDVALAVPVAVLALTALVGAGVALSATGRRATGFSVVTVIVGILAATSALASAGLTAIVASIVAAALVAFMVVGEHHARRVVGGLALAPVLALAVSGFVFTVGGDAAWIAIPVLLAVGSVAVAAARAEVEATAAVVALIALPVSLGATTDVGGLAALWLAVAGFLACSSALLHESRRDVAWVGAVLLFLATWVRLADLEVREPEAYTLPLAAALLALGGWRMQRSPAVGSTEALLPGLLLATLPSLLWVLGDPISVRALALGAACLVLTIAGASLRWSAPLTVGATVGAVIVFRELGPYAGDFPKWVWIGLAGALLTIVGITWERRLLDVRRAAGYLGRLR